MRERGRERERERNRERERERERETERESDTILPYFLLLSNNRASKTFDASTIPRAINGL